MDEELLGGDWGYKPARWRTPALVAASCVVLVGLSIAFVDRPVATYSHDVIHHPMWAKLLTKLANLPDPVALLAMLAVLGLYFWRGRMTTATRTVLAAALATVAATAAVIILKIVFGRLWPETWIIPPNPSWINTHQYGFEPFHGGRGYESFPSGHTTRITAPFAVLWQRLPRYRILWVLPTVLVMVGLLASDFHFVGDCLAGIYLGIGTAALIMMYI